MNIPNLLKLADVLDSGEYTQCRGYYAEGPKRLCVSGVAAVLAGCEPIKVESGWTIASGRMLIGSVADEFIGSGFIRERLTDANDAGKTFPELAAMIREMVAKEQERQHDPR